MHLIVCAALPAEGGEEVLDSSFKDQWRISAEFPPKLHHLQSGCFHLPRFFPVLRGPGNVRYFGDSYLEFAAVELAAVNDITVSFQTAAARGTLLYVDQGPANAHFFMKLFLINGLLQVETKTSVGHDVPSVSRCWRCFPLSCCSIPSAVTRRRGLHRSDQRSLLMTARFRWLISGIIPFFCFAVGLFWRKTEPN